MITTTKLGIMSMLAFVANFVFLNYLRLINQHANLKAYLRDII